jgi:hypothetical protein
MKIDETNYFIAYKTTDSGELRFATGRRDDESYPITYSAEGVRYGKGIPTRELAEKKLKSVKAALTSYLNNVDADSIDIATVTVRTIITIG